MSKHELSRPQLIAATAGVMLALLLAALDQTIVGTALPRIVAELNGLDRYSWLVTGYLVSTTVVTPIAGKMGDLFGRKPFLLAGMIGFVAASALCGQARDMNQLILFRILQGLFGGALFASAFAVIGDIFPPRQRVRIQGLFGGVFGLASILGPVVGGFLTDNWGWRWVFYVNLPVGIAGVLVVLAFLPFIRSQASWRDIDFLGVATLAGGLTPLLLALSVAKDDGWTSPQVLGGFGLAAVILIAFFLIERRAREPIVPFELFSNRVFAVAMAISFLTGVSMFGMMIFVPLELQGVLGVTVTNSGLLLTPMMVGLIVASVISGQLMVRIKRYRFLGTLGVAVMMTGIYLMSLITTSSHQLDVTRDAILVGLGLGVIFPLYLSAVQSALPPKYLGVGTSQVQFWRQIGGTISVAVLGSLLAQRLPGAISDQLGRLSLPPQLRQLSTTSSSGDPNSIFDPAKQAAFKARLEAIPNAPPHLYDQLMHAVRTGLANTLHDLFGVALLLTSLALVVSVLLPEVPLRGRTSSALAEAPAPEPAEEVA